MPVDFTKEEEVKEYIENLGIEYRYGCFSEKNPEVCQLLGEYLDAIKKDYHKAAKIFKANCDDNSHPRSCHAYANHCLTGKGIEKQDYEAAFTYYTKACDLNIPASCVNAGLLTVNTKTEKGYTKGIEFLDKGCNLKNAYACYFLSGLFITGSKDEIIKKDMNKAFKYAEKACDLGNLYACINVSIMYKKGEGVEKNDELSEKFKKKAEEIQAELESGLTLEFQRGS